MSSGPTYLVTGGAGFIGSHIVERLLGDGHSVRVVDNLSTGRALNLGFARGLPAGRFDLIECDLGDLDRLRPALAGVDGVFHQAALPSVPRSVKDPLESHRVNTTGTLGLLIAAREAGVPRLVYASSSSVYGDSPELPKVESMPPRPLSPYATGKLTAEHYCRVFHHLYGLGTVALRYFNVFGPRQDPTSEYAAVIPKFISALGRGESPLVHGDGTQSRDFTFIADVVEANLRGMEAAPGAWGRAYNVAAGRRVTLLQLLDMLRDLLGVDVAARFGPPRPGDVPHSQADSSLARMHLGWEARVSMEEGLRRTVASWTAGERDAG
ncbi:MAG: SDR family oxidoreductase [Acidobacteriota bacterium]|jgi:nucleoside-diphosphate-sugar epimerase